MQAGAWPRPLPTQLCLPRNPCRPAEPERALQGHPHCPPGQYTKGARAPPGLRGLGAGPADRCHFSAARKTNPGPLSAHRASRVQVPQPLARNRVRAFFSRRKSPHTLLLLSSTGAGPLGQAVGGTLDQGHPGSPGRVPPVPSALELGPGHSGEDGGEIRPAVPPSRRPPAVVGHLLPQLRGARWPWLPPHLRLPMRPREAPSPEAWSGLSVSTCLSWPLCWGGGGGIQSPQSRLAGRRGRKDRLWTAEIQGRIPILAHLPPHACPSSRGPGPSMLSLPGTPSPPHIPRLLTALWSHPQGHSPCWPLGYPRCCREGPSPGPSLSLRSHCRPTLSGASGALHGLPTKCWA